VCVGKKKDTCVQLPFCETYAQRLLSLPCSHLLACSQVRSYCIFLSRVIASTLSLSLFRSLVLPAPVVLDRSLSFSPLAMLLALGCSGGHFLALSPMDPCRKSSPICVCHLIISSTFFFLPPQHIVVLPLLSLLTQPARTHKETNVRSQQESRREACLRNQRGCQGYLPNHLGQSHDQHRSAFNRSRST